MENIKNKEHYSDIIMGQSRHQFIYAYNGQERTGFLKKLALKYPIILDKSRPMGIYLEEIGIPKSDKSMEGLDKIALSAFHREYFYFLVASGIVDTSFKQISEQDLECRTKEFLNRVNKLMLNKAHTSISSLQELKIILNEVKQAYLFNYEQYIASGQLKSFVDNLPISFLWLDKFVELYKKMLNNNSYFAILIDHQKPINSLSYRAINSLVASRINADLSMKVICEPKSWGSHCDFNGNFIENVHDYGTVELDDSFKEHMKKLK